ncbi:serine protease [Lentzea sp. NBRC 105346]|uniref:S8 family peptidase n=1 Tax=Lentzea sp. NBRC 105346 TaxID=3032205 RepID=UPI0024A5D9F4|nr:S8 family serine peptidase [Lentzea sp. NBRC 105346]GLZ29843.1 serine protease [Lentzea sp. NBRC 105346]
MRTLFCAAAATLVIAAQPATAAESRGTTTNPLQQPTSASLTLVTGDRVDYTELPNGRLQAAVTPGEGRKHVTFARRADKDSQGRPRLTVIPSDAQRLLAAGKLDARLFDVMGLVREHITGEVPLIVGFPPGVRATGGAKIRRELPAINGVAVTARDGFWSQVKDTGARIWLDGRRKLVDEQSNAQIGVPAAWQAGYTGKGVKVAVLDTGIDATHPDLAGKISAQQDFTETGVKDNHGHGTHVAANIAGTGAASGGRHKGVAPDAQLLVGKVCGTDYCDDSAILQGMQWAADQGADVVSMSLGGTDRPGLDPLEEAVNTLTESTGTLFVIAAGNTPAYESVGSPASADAALGVGSVNKSDAISWFSSRGPRVGDAALKPDIAAPGEDIISARAAGTSMGTPVDNNYTAASGTSMATPHVSGAAAVLAQAHPDWKAGQLKAALTTSAQPVEGDVFSQGTGRLDVARAVTTTVTATPSVSFGRLSWPYPSRPVVTKPITYANDGNAAVTLDLATDTPGFTLGAKQITVPAHGTASVELTLTPSNIAEPGYRGGRVTATSGGTVVRTAFGLTAEHESYNLTVEYIGRDGKPASPDLDHFISIYNLADLGILDSGPLVGGTAVTRLRKDDYRIDAKIGTAGTPTSWTTVVTPKFTLDRDKTIVVDARGGRKISIQTDKPDAVADGLSTSSLVKSDLGWLHVSHAVYDSDDSYAVPLKDSADQLDFGIDATLRSPDGAKDPYTYSLAYPFAGEVPAALTFRVRDKQLGRVDHRYRGQDVDSRAFRFAFTFYLPHQWVGLGTMWVEVETPGRRTEFFSPGIDWLNLMRLIPREGGMPSPALFGGTENYTAGSVSKQDWNSAVSGPEMNIVQSGGVARRGNDLGVIVPLFVPGGRQNSIADPGLELAQAQGSVTLSAGDYSRTSEQYMTFFSVPADERTYTLNAKAKRDVRWARLSTAVDATWTFRSKTVEGNAFEFLPLVTARLHGVDLDDYNRAKAFSLSQFKIQVATQTSAIPAAIRTVSLEASYNDGKSWYPMWVRGKSSVDTWDAVVVNPKIEDTTGYVSLRVKAGDVNGNTVDQTVIRAYALK